MKLILCTISFTFLMILFLKILVDIFFLLVTRLFKMYLVILGEYPFRSLPWVKKLKESKHTLKKTVTALFINDPKTAKWT